MIYTTGTIAISGSTLTGTGTNFTASGSLIRVGCTVIAMSNPVQVFQITAVGSATSLSVTPAASPALAAGTKFAILLSDSLSVDGLAQDIAETFTLYQKNISGFADVMNGSADVTITINGVAVTVPGQQSLAKKGANKDITSLSGLTTALSVAQGGTGGKDAPAARTNLQLERVEQTSTETNVKSPDGTKKIIVTNSDWGAYDITAKVFLPLPMNRGGTGAADATAAAVNLKTFINNGAVIPTTATALTDYVGRPGSAGESYTNNVTTAGVANVTDWPTKAFSTSKAYGWGHLLALRYGGNEGYCTQLMFSNEAVCDVHVRNQFGGAAFRGWAALLSDKNTTVDANGFIKKASPIVKIFGSGNSETNEESEGVTVVREAEGVYLVSGCLGLNSDLAWGGMAGGIEVPKDINGQPQIWVNYDVESTGDIVLRTYHREHSTAPVFARNIVDGYSDGSPRDIPTGVFVSLRVEMPQDSKYNIAKEKAEKEMMSGDNKAELVGDAEDVRMN